MTIHTLLTKPDGTRLEMCDHKGALEQGHGYVKCRDCESSWADTAVMPLVYVAPHYFTTAEDSKEESERS